ncbi:MAG: methyltransferase domain-containing protein [Kiloniellaceae bacterium]
MALQSKAATTISGKAKIPFWVRLKAWWEGYDLALRQKQLLAAEMGDLGGAARNEQEARVSKRLEVMQQLWGTGMSGPGDEDYILKLVKPFALDPAFTVIDVGAGLGGATRLISEHFDVWLTGLEADREVADAGMELSTMAGLAKRAPIHYFDMDRYEFRENSTDCVFSKESLYLVDDKDRLLKEIIHMIKPRGQLLFTDYVVAEDADERAVFDWADGEPGKPNPWTMRDYEVALTEARLDIRIKEDITEQVNEIITGSWARFLSQLKGRTLDKDTSAAVTDAVELWARRTKAIDAGALKICRFHALKKDAEKMLSDW